MLDVFVPLQLADRLIGIYKTDNATKTVTIHPTLVAGARPAPVLCSPLQNYLHSCFNSLHLTNQQYVTPTPEQASAATKARVMREAVPAEPSATVADGAPPLVVN
jgi:hypothetical protein